jgi:hypothetical protein
MKLFLTRGLYGQREWAHFDAYRREAGYWFIELGSWTLELELTWSIKHEDQVL